MLTFRAIAVTDPVAHLLLTEYFASRAASFPVVQGTYHTAFPTPEQFVPPAGVFLVAEEDGEPVGCGGVRRIADRECADGPVVRYEVKHLWMRPGVRGRGYGRAILAELEQRAIGFGAQEAVLDTNSSLEAAGGLYRVMGYVDIPPYNDNPNATNWYSKPLG